MGDLAGSLPESVQVKITHDKKSCVGLWGQSVLLQTKPKDSGGNSEDPEQAKLRVGFNSTIIGEKPNVKWTDIMRLESTKQSFAEVKEDPGELFYCMDLPEPGKSYLAKYCICAQKAVEKP
ncbi:hypothetical protein Fmac_002830 [Flemingia macrophylla]|uniref:Uncharacterized protein n=1 Tax=Flemingia macrophylla TaxID=520843 RepID=A0ABD1NNW7_9FABA